MVGSSNTLPAFCFNLPTIHIFFFFLHIQFFTTSAVSYFDEKEQPDILPIVCARVKIQCAMRHHYIRPRGYSPLSPLGSDPVDPLQINGSTLRLGSRLLVVGPLPVGPLPVGVLPARPGFQTGPVLASKQYGRYLFVFYSLPHIWTGAMTS